jgi:N-carbamoyl-L-amino-acid hydrolase
MDTLTELATTHLRVDGDRLWASLMELARIGATPKGGVCRLALTDLDKQGRELVTGWGRDAGCRCASTASATSSCGARAATTACRR